MTSTSSIPKGPHLEVPRSGAPAKLVVTMTQGMRPTFDDASWLRRTADLLEVRLDAYGDGGGPLRVGEVAAVLTRGSRLLTVLVEPGQDPVPLLATASAAPGAAGRCTSRGQALTLLRAAAMAGIDWIDFDLALDSGLGARLGEHWEGRVAEALVRGATDDPVVEAALSDFFAERISELVELSVHEGMCFVFSEHWTRTRDTVAEGVEPLGVRLAVITTLLERLASERRDLAPVAVKLVETAGGGVEEGAARRYAFEFLAAIPRVRQLLGEGAHAPELFMFAGGRFGTWTRSLCTAFGSQAVYAAARPDQDLPVPGQATVIELTAAWPDGRPPRVGTPVFGVVGERIEGSSSPALFTDLLRRTECRGVYGRFDLADPAPLFERLDDARLPLVGLSVTAPHKRAAWHFGGGDAEVAACGLRGLGAYNTLWRTAAGWHGTNTDVVGVRAAVEALFGEDWFARPRRVVVLGAGGTARAVAKALTDPRATAAFEPWLAAWRSGAATLPPLAGEARATAPAAVEFVVLAREPMRAMGLAREFGASFGGFEELATLTPDLVVHATPLGSPAASEAHIWLPGVPALADLAARAPHCRILDANYKPAPTPLVAAARELGLEAKTGRLWFWAQAAAQWARFAANLEPLPGVALPAGPDLVERARPDALHDREAPLLILIGQRGVGKTSLGCALAERDGQVFRDLDDELARSEGASSAGDLFASVGEAAFRRAETARFGLALARAAHAIWGPGRREIWATGGGLLTTPEARAALAAARASGLARVLWLRGEPEALGRRVVADPTLRPALFGASAVEFSAEHAIEEARRIAADRDPHFRALADEERDTTHLSLEALVAGLARSRPR